MEETGGKIFRSNGIHPGDVRIAVIADPLDTEIANRNEGTLEVLKAISTCSYVRVDSNRITGGRTTPGKHPEAPAAATFFRTPPFSIR